MLNGAAHLQVGDTVEGIIPLPGEQLRFRADVVRRSDDGQRVGLQFCWSAPGDADPLNACLYGNTLQWDVNNWSETQRGRLLPSIGGEPDNQYGSWRFAYAVVDGGERIPCVLRQEDTIGSRWRLVCYERPAAMEGIRLLQRGDSPAVGGLHVTGSERFSVGKGHIHILLLSTNPQPVSFESHRQPRWTSASNTEKLYVA
jgi:hypothetical protein